MLQSIMKDLPGNVPHFFSKPSIIPLHNPLAQDRDIKISMLRLDEIHPVISGNKIFKLLYYLKESLRSGHKKIITFGGAYSNHLAATALMCKLCSIECIGIVRGEEPGCLSETLIFCRQNGMSLRFISREMYQKMASLDICPDLTRQFGKHVLVPEGGFSIPGMKGAALINTCFKADSYTHICLSIGTATTLAGLLDKSKLNIIGFPALKGLNDVEERLTKCGIIDMKNLAIENDYHFGGFGKISPELIDFMNQFYDTYDIPLDRVYTGKMMYGVFDMLEKRKFPEGSRLLCIHTGGLQGNSSLREQLHQTVPFIYFCSDELSGRINN